MAFAGGELTASCLPSKEQVHKLLTGRVYAKDLLRFVLEYDDRGVHRVSIFLFLATSLFVAEARLALLFQSRLVQSFARTRPIEFFSELLCPCYFNAFSQGQSMVHGTGDVARKAYNFDPQGAPTALLFNWLLSTDGRGGGG